MMLFMVIIFLSLYISGVMMTQVISTSYNEDTERQLKNVAQDASIYIMLYYADFWTEAEFEQAITEKAVLDKDVIWWIRSDGSVSVYNMGQDENVNKELIQQYYSQVSEELNEGNTMSIKTKGDWPVSPAVMTIARPLLDADRGNEYLFVHKKLTALNESMQNIYRQIVLSVAISAILAMVLTYIFTRYMLRPLTVVSKGARQLARGHFDIWLEVRSKDEIGQMADTFNSLARELRKYKQSRDSFVANVSHELRSPLTSMQGLVQGVVDGTIPENEANHYLNVVLDETKRLNKLISNMLNLSKIESGQFRTELGEVEVNELIRRVLITFESKIDVKNLMVEVDFQHNKELAIANQDQLVQVVQNIMDNAIKFADYGGRLRISTMDEKGSIFVSINNSGEPIPRADIPYLFDRFYKGDASHTRVQEGTGIGLSLVKKILEEHRQRIWVESDSIGGTTFTFTLTKAGKDK